MNQIEAHSTQRGNYFLKPGSTTFLVWSQRQIYTLYLEEMQTSWGGLRRTRAGGVTKDAPKEKAEKGLS